MTGDETDLPYDLVPARIAELAEHLEAHNDPDVVATAGELLDWVDAFHLAGLRALVELVTEWRGEIFLEHASQHPVAGLLLRGYGLAVAPDKPDDARGEAADTNGAAAGAPSSTPLVAVSIGRKPTGS